MKRRVPKLKTDEEAEMFLDTDLSNLDFSRFKSGRLRFEGNPQPPEKAAASKKAGRPTKPR